MSDIENRLRASMSFGVLDGSAEERGILGAQIEEAIRELIRLRARAEAAERERDEAIRQIGPLAAENTRLRGALEQAQDALMPFAAYGRALLRVEGGSGHMKIGVGGEIYELTKDHWSDAVIAALAGKGEENIAEDSYFYMAELLEPHTRRQGGSLPESVVESFQMLLEHWTKSRAGEGERIRCDRCLRTYTAEGEGPCWCGGTRRTEKAREA